MPDFQAGAGCARVLQRLPRARLWFLSLWFLTCALRGDFLCPTVTPLPPRPAVLWEEESVATATSSCPSGLSSRRRASSRTHPLALPPRGPSALSTVHRPERSLSQCAHSRSLQGRDRGTDCVSDLPEVAQLVRGGTRAAQSQSRSGVARDLHDRRSCCPLVASGPASVLTASSRLPRPTRDLAYT